MPSRPSITIVLVLVAATASAADRPYRYVARLATGERVESDRLQNWHDAKAQPQLGGVSLLDPANPFSWLRTRDCRLPEEPAAYVEFTNGDRLPGQIVGMADRSAAAASAQLPHLVVRVAVGFEPPQNRPVREIRILPQYLRRIVWQRHGAPRPAAGTALFRDGRQLSFRAVHFQANAMHLLTADGERRVNGDSLAELHLPAVDAWSAWFDTIAAVCPTTSTRLLQAETASGLSATASLATFTARFEGNSADPDRWVHGLQPAWSLDILWIPLREIARYRSFWPTQAPLSRMLPHAVRSQPAALETAAAVRIDHGVQGGPLQNGLQEFGWGFGASGAVELRFDLPRGASKFQTSVCLDAAAGNSGCIRPQIFVRQLEQETQLWQGPVLIGSRAVADTGLLRWKSSERSAAQLQLRIDPVIGDKPPGADPLEIRDYANWCDPLLEFDEPAVAAQFAQRLAALFAAWRGWNVANASGDQGRSPYAVSLHANGQIPGSFEPAIRCARQSLVLTREIAVTNADQWLVLAATRLSERLPEPKIEVRIEGQLVAEHVPPLAGTGTPSPRPLVVPLAPYRPKSGSISAEIRQIAISDSPPVQYRRIEITESPPDTDAQNPTKNPH